jgi:hypothetical protein
MVKKSTVRQVDFWDSAPSQLDRLTYFSRLEDSQQRAEGWRRNILYATGFIIALMLLVILVKAWR